jgi:hypothetical protein
MICPANRESEPSMTPHSWQKSSYCAAGEACLHVATGPGPTSPAVHLTESADPSGAVLTTTPAAFAHLLAALKRPA